MSKELYLIHGKPGSGKTTASRLATERLGDTYHFAMGDELRARALHGKPSKHSEELKKYAEELKQSLPVPPHLATLVFEECIESSPCDRVIVDGYPQYVDRLPEFETTLKKTDARVLAICLIKVPDYVARQRLLDRGQRSTDVAEDSTYIDKRLQGFQKNASPTLEALSRDYAITEINGEQDPESIANDILTVITSHG